MSYNNHDGGDPNAVKYVKAKDVEFTKEDEVNGRAIKIYLEANTKPLKEFLIWFRTLDK
ncbi:hypothetical protein [Pedobacter changchengzhani]|uniref:hypothetical protein n=1 Tax=Pedobacter changchengzhani TaxID=2529274 RepID=UPI001404462D|nr:hypothetical protein [Pedobacter changchengzhani]